MGSKMIELAPSASPRLAPFASPCVNSHVTTGGPSMGPTIGTPEVVSGTAEAGVGVNVDCARAGFATTSNAQDAAAARMTVLMLGACPLEGTLRAAVASFTQPERNPLRECSLQAHVLLSA